MSLDIIYKRNTKKTSTSSSISSFPPGLQNSCSPPSLSFPHPKPRSFLPPLIHPKPTSFKFPAFLPESPCRVRTWKSLCCPSCLPCTPPHPSPFHRSPHVSVPPCFFPSLSHPSRLLLPLLYVMCVSSHPSLDSVYKKRKGFSSFSIHLWNCRHFMCFLPWFLFCAL